MAEALLRRRKSMGPKAGTQWILTNDGTTDLSGTWEVPATGFYEIEMHGGGGGGAAYFSQYGASGGGSGAIYGCILIKGEQYPYTIGAGGAGKYGGTGGTGGTTTFGTDMYKVLGGTGGTSTYSTVGIAGKASGGIATDGKTGKYATIGDATTVIGGYGNKNNTTQTYGNGGDVDIPNDNAMAGKNGGIIITYLGKESMWPSGYTRVSYIESTGIQYIDTGFAPNQDTRVILSVNVPTAPTATSSLFGARTSTTSGAYICIYTTSLKAWAIDYSTNANRYSFSGVKIGDIDIDFNKNTATVNGNSKTWDETTFQANCNMTLFALHTNNKTVNSYSKAKMYKCKIYNNDSLVRDFIPCINPDGEVGLYDLVSKNFFGNASGSGAFTAG